MCASCLRAGDHGHDPRHAFSLVLRGAKSADDVLPLLPPGRNVCHAALCNKCDRTIYGIRHKCIDCPDWDYCADCVASAPEAHPGHRLVPVFDNKDVAPLYKTVRHSNVLHTGVYCDGPVCAQYKPGVCIRGVRFKCAICPDTDFCGTCEASPTNNHNPTHPLIRFRTPIRHVLVTSTDETNALMGDVPPSLTSPAQQQAQTFLLAAEMRRRAVAEAAAAAAAATVTIPTTASASTNTVSPPPYPAAATAAAAAAVVTTANTATQVQTIADVKPTEEFAAPVPQAKKAEEQEKEEEEKQPEQAQQPEVGEPKPKAAPAVPAPPAPVAAPAVSPKVDLCATFVGDSIADGTALTVGQEFTQTWYMKNVGSSAWPAGITVKFCGGDYMFLKSAEHSLNATLTDSEVAPGVTVGFSVALSATWPPNRSYISYWRLVAPDGRRFGDSLWCNINVTEDPNRAHATPFVGGQVEPPKDDDRNSDADSSESVVDVNSVKSVKDDDAESATEVLARSQASSEMVFPKLPVESPVHSLEQLPVAVVGGTSSTSSNKQAPTSPTVMSSSSHKTFALSEDGDVEEEVDVSSIDSEGFMTDEEYDVLCASDEEFEECERI